MSLWYRVFCGLGVLCLLLTSCYETRFLPEDEVLYTGISRVEMGPFAETDDAPLVRDEVNAVLHEAPNNSLFGSSQRRFPLPIGLWAYNKYVGSQKKFGKWMFNTFAAEPKTLTSVNPKVHAQVAQNVLRNYGYFSGQVTYKIEENPKNPRKAKVSYSVSPGDVHRLDSIEYQRFPQEADSLIQQSLRRTKLRRGEPFTTASLNDERTRLSTQFLNNGYYFCQPSYFTYRADTLQRPGWVQLQVRPSQELPEVAGRRFYLRNTRIYLTDTGGDPTQFNDSVGRGAVRMYFYNPKLPETLNLKPKSKHSPLKFGVLRRLVFYNKGDLYRQRLQNIVQEKISGLGIFSQISYNYVLADTTATCDSLDVEMRLTLDKPYDSELKVNAATKSNGYVGPALSFTMTKRNAFRGAESLGFRTYGSYEWMTGASAVKDNSSVLNSYEYGLSINLDYPYIRLFRLGRKFLRHSVSSTSYKIEANWLNRAAYFGRVSLGAHIDYTLQRTPTLKHALTLLRLDYNLQLHSTAAFDSIASANQALYVSMRNQFVPSMQYTLVKSSRRTARNPRSFTLTVKEAGNVTSGIYAACGRRFNEKDKNLFGAPFAQYMKVTAEFTDRIKLWHTNTYLAGRVMAGAVVSYGNARIAPYNDLFSIGGASSIRAFAMRSIGPGSYNPARSGYSYIDQMGDLKFELNLEYRFPIISSLWGAVFMDTGNVWLMRNNEDHPGGEFRFRNLGRQLALGTGAGLRYDLDFLVIRFDVGVGLHAPYETGRSGYYNMPKFSQTLGYHLAIGYPF